MRLSTDEERDEERGLATIAAAAEAGITVFDTARSYGDNEALLAQALRRSTVEAGARIVTKGGMSRRDGAWIPDGRAKAIRADCEASLAALDGLAIDLYLIHAPDPRTPWRTSVRALARLVDDGLVRRVGVANVNRPQLDEAIELAPIAAVQVALSPYDDRPLRGGVIDRCSELEIAVLAHSPLGGPRRAGRLDRREALAEVAATRGATPAEVALAWLLELSPVIVPIPGARRPETARSAAGAASLSLKAADRESLDRAFGVATRRSRPARRDGDVVVVMGIPGAGKSRVADDLVRRGYHRLNRDERGGTLRALAEALDETLSAGVGRVVLDNTYLSRAARSHVIETAARHRLAPRCIWLDTPLADAQVNLVWRLLERFGSLPTPAKLRELGRHEPGVLTPTSQMRTLRELEPPAADEGFASVDHLPFVRAEARGRAGVLVAAAAHARPGWEDALARADRSAPHLVFDWNPDGNRDGLDAAAAHVADGASGTVESALCPHPAGPPICWCRPPLPGLPLAFARAHGVDPARSLLIGTGAAHRGLAAALGASYIQV